MLYPHAGSGVWGFVEIDPVHFLARCSKRWLHWVLSVLYLIPGFLWICVCCNNYGYFVFCLIMLLCVLSLSCSGLVVSIRQVIGHKDPLMKPPSESRRLSPQRPDWRMSCIFCLCCCLYVIVHILSSCFPDPT